MFKNEENRKVSTRYYLPKVEIKEYNVMIDGKNFFDQPAKSSNNIRKIATGQGDDYTTGYNYFKEYCTMIAIDLSKQQGLDADPKAIQ